MAAVSLLLYKLGLFSELRTEPVAVPMHVAAITTWLYRICISGHDTQLTRKPSVATIQSHDDP